MIKAKKPQRAKKSRKPVSTKDRAGYRQKLITDRNGVARRVWVKK